MGFEDCIIALKIILLLFFLYFTVASKAQISDSTIYLKVGQQLDLSTDVAGNQNGTWCQYTPKLNSNSISHNRVCYFPGPIVLSPIWFRKAGVFYFCLKKTHADTICTELTLSKLYTGTVLQVVVREDDSYTGYLTELLGVPFLLPPYFLEGNKHQTDLRIGADCAEMAIYGKRRMGCQIPYVGPKGIFSYLVPIEKIKKGAIIHFGEQVSVVYEDVDGDGKLGKSDLLIHAWKDQVKIVTYRDSEFWGKPYGIFDWKF